MELSSRWSRFRTKGELCSPGAPVARVAMFTSDTAAVRGFEDTAVDVRNSVRVDAELRFKVAF